MPGGPSKAASPRKKLGLNKSVLSSIMSGSGSVQSTELNEGSSFQSFSGSTTKELNAREKQIQKEVSVLIEMLSLVSKLALVYLV